MEDIYVYFPAKDSASLKTQSTLGNVSLKDCFQISRQFLFVLISKIFIFVIQKQKFQFFFKLKKLKTLIVIFIQLKI